MRSETLSSTCYILSDESIIPFYSTSIYVYVSSLKLWKQDDYDNDAITLKG